MRYIPFVAFLTLLAGMPLSAEKICESCIRRQQSHKDDLSKVGYYEDSTHFNSNLREATNAYDDGQSRDDGISWIPQKPEKTKLKATNTTKTAQPKN